MTDPFASVANTYDIMVDWPARLARERPFFEQLLAERPARRVLDVGCGTGHHSRMFAGLGLEAVGIDPSEAMLAGARELSPGDNPRFILGGFADIRGLHESFDLVVVLGNTLAYVGNAAELTIVLRRIHHVLNPGGRVVLQVVNYDNVLAEESYWMPLINRMVDDREYLFLREYRRLGHRVEFTIITLMRDGVWTRIVERSTHCAIIGEVLLTGLRDAGFTDVRYYGDYQFAPYDPAISPSLIAVAEKG